MMKLKKNSIQAQNKTLYKCKQYRSQFIHREIGDLIKKQLRTFFQSKKLEKQIENHDKDYIVMDMPSPLDRVKQFRAKERDRSYKMLLQFHEKQRKQKSQQENHQALIKSKNFLRAKQNLQKMQVVKNKYDSLQEGELEKLQNLHKTINSCRSTLSTRHHRKSAPAYQDPLIQSRIQTAKERSRKVEDENINRYMKKMKEIQNRCLKKQLEEQKRKQRAIKISHSTISKRNEIQEKKIHIWKEHYENSFSRFNQNRNFQISSKKQTFINASQTRSIMRSLAQERRNDLQQSVAKQRIDLLQEKLQRIKRVPKRQNRENQRSKQNFHRKQIEKYFSIQVLGFDEQKEKHNIIMHKIHEILQKLKGLNQQNKLSANQIRILLESMDKNDPLFPQLENYLKNSKDQFFERKEKEEEERVKKQKKGNMSMGLSPSRKPIPIKANFQI